MKLEIQIIAKPNIFWAVLVQTKVKIQQDDIDLTKLN